MLRARQGIRDGWQSAIIELDQEFFTLALGWQISAATHKVVSFIIGSPAYCRGMPSPRAAQEIDPATGERPSITAGRVGNNSCVIKAITRLLDPF
jgi:hypothetical protein